MHAIANKLDESEDNAGDNASFGEVLGRLERTLKDPKDSMFIEAYFDLIDKNGDGYINYEELVKLSKELSQPLMNEKVFLAMAEKIS